MTIILYGNSYKYEIEAVVKIFFPAVRFNFISAEAFLKAGAEDDYCRAKMRRFREHIYLIADIRLGCRVWHRAIRTKDGDCEALLCRMIYTALSKLSGITSPWGMLTGVRPVKLVRKLLAENPDENALMRHFQQKYLIPHENKLRLAVDIAHTQEKILNSLPKDSFALYAGIPFCPTRCTYCSFVSQPAGSVRAMIPRYTELLCEELEYIANTAEECALRLDTVYLGGGTPTALPEKELNQLLGHIKGRFDFSHLREFCVEAGRPDTITPQKLEILKRHGVSRISINTQTTKQETLDIIGRKHSVAQFFDSFSLARKLGFENINTDLIAGLPGESPEDFKKTLDSILLLQPEGVTVHTLTMKRSAEMFGGKLPDADAAKKMIDYAHHALRNAGYEPYYLYRQKNTAGNLENTGYAKPGFESLYNVYIMEECQTIFAAGCAGISKIIGKNVTRICNYKYPNEYTSGFSEIIKRKKDILAALKNNNY